MPDAKPPSAPAPLARPARSLGLKEKAPPKPARRLRAIPPALVISGAASKVPPPPRPPLRAHVESIPKSGRAQSSRGPNSRAQSSRAPSSRPHSSRPKGSRSERSQPESLRRLVAATPMQAPDARSEYRETARPVAATLRPTAPRRASALIVGLGLAGALFGTWWVLREPRSLQSSAPAIAPGTEARATPARPPVATPATAKPRAVRPLDHEEGIASPRAADARSAEPPSVQDSQAPSAVAGSVHSARGPASAADIQAQPAIEDPEPPGTRAPATESDAPANSTLPVTPLPALAAFDAGAAKRALGTTALVASSCRKGDDPRGTAEVIVTFAPSGRVTSANVNAAPYGGTATGGCIAAAMRAAVVPPFGGDHVTVRKLVTVR